MASHHAIRVSVLASAALMIAGCNALVRFPENPPPAEQEVIKGLPYKDPGLGAVASMVLPGAGQVYAGDLGPGFLTFGRQMLALPAVMLLGLYIYRSEAQDGSAFTLGVPLMTIGLVSSVAFWMVGVNDGWVAVNAYNVRLAEAKGKGAPRKAP